MSETANQPQGSDAGVLDHQGFLGVEPDVDFSAEESPETSAEEITEEVSADAEVEGEAGEQAEQPSSIQERLKDLTQREAEEYQGRYPNAWKRLNDPNVSEDDKHLLIDKIESDKEIARLRAQEEYWISLQEEPTPEEAEPETQPTTPQDPAAVRQAYYQRIDNVVKSYVDPQAVQQLGMDVLTGLGVDVSKVNDPNLAPQDRTELQSLIQNAPKLGGALARAATDLFATLLPVFFQEAQEMAYPGFGKSHEREMYATQWEAVRNQPDPQGKALYANLPAYGTQQFKTALRAASAQIPGFDDMVFKGPNGLPLPPADQAAKKYSILAKLVAGQRVSPAVVAQAVQTGKTLATKAAQRRAAGRALGAGQATNRDFKTNADSDDPVLAALDAELASTNENIRPVSRYSAKR